MKARLAALTAVAAVAMNVLQVPAAQARPALEPTPARARAGRIAWAYVSSGQPKKSFYNKKSTAPVGLSRKAVYRSYFKLSMAEAVGQDNVDLVALRIPVSTPNPCRKGGAPAVNVYLTKGISSRTTWKNQPKIVKRLGTVKPNCTTKALELDLTKTAIKVLDNGWDSLTLGLAAADEKKAGGFLRFSNSARLMVTAYNDADNSDLNGDPAANVPQGVTNAAVDKLPCATGADRPQIQDTTAAFTGTVADADGGFIGLRVQWQAAVAGQAKTLDSQMQFSTPNEARDFKIAPPAGSFGDKTVYRWRLQGFDDVAAGPWTDWCEFSVALPAADQAATAATAAN